MARSQNKKQRRKAKLKKRAPNPRPSTPFRMPEAARVSKLKPADDQEIRQFIRHELEQKTDAKTLSSLLKVKAKGIVQNMKLKPDSDPKGFERKIQDKLQSVLEEEAFANAYPALVDHPEIRTQAHRLAIQNEAEGMGVDASKVKVDAFIHQKLEKKLAAQKRLEKVWLSKIEPIQKETMERIKLATREALDNGRTPDELRQLARDKAEIYDVSAFEKALRDNKVLSEGITFDPLGVVEGEFENIERETPFYERLGEACGGDLQSSGAFRKAVELELRGERPTNAVESSAKAFIKKAVAGRGWSNPQSKVEATNKLMSAIGQAITAHKERPVKDVALQSYKQTSDIDKALKHARILAEVKGLDVAEVEAEVRLQFALAKKDEAIDNLAGKGKPNPMDDDLREMIKDRLERGETDEQIEQFLMGGSAQPGIGQKSRKLGRERIHQMIGEVSREENAEANQLLDYISEDMTKAEKEDFISRVAARAGKNPKQQLGADRIEAIADEIRSRRNLSDEEIRRELKAHKLDDYGNDDKTEKRLFEAVRQLSPEERPAFYETLSHHVHHKRGQPLNLDDLVAEVKGQRGSREKAEPQFATGGAWDKYQTKKRPIPQEQSVECYMEMLTNAYKLTKTGTPKERQERVYLWRCLRDARVFHFDPEVYVGLHQEVDRYTTEELTGLTYQASGTFDTKTRSPEKDEESKRLKATILRESKHAPYPEKFPFPSVFLGHGGGLNTSRALLMLSAPAALRERIEIGAILGHLLTDDGVVYSCVKAAFRDDEGQLTGVIWFDPLRVESGWVRSEFNLEPWILPQLIKIINEHRTFILESAMSKALRKDYKQNRKGMGIKPDKRAYTPPPYYTLRMKSKIIRQKVRRSLPRQPLPKTYKTDVRAHERCRVARGPLPLDPETGAKLRGREYKIFTTHSLDLDTYRRLGERGIPYKKADEWLAIKVTWVETHMSSNDPKLPYIPAVRVPGEVHLKPKKPTGSWADNPAR